METLITFGLGAGTVLIILGVVVVFKLVKEVKSLKQTTADVETTVIQEVNNLHRRVDEVESTIYSQMDSRLDKLEQRLSGNSGAKQLLKG
jgi:predicted PurR-regulated permease PerM